MAQTRALIYTCLPRDLAGIVIGYFECDGSAYELARDGQYEACMHDYELNEMMAGACAGGHPAIVDAMIARGANNWDWGLNNACYGGHRTLVELMIARGATHFTYAMGHACEAGHRELVTMMLKLGARGPCRHCNS